MPYKFTRFLLELACVAFFFWCYKEIYDFATSRLLKRNLSMQGELKGVFDKY